MQELLAAGVHRDVSPPNVLFARQHGLRRDRTVVQQPLELGEFVVEEAAQGGSDVDVTTGEFQTHIVSLRCQLSAFSSQPPF